MEILGYLQLHRVSLRRRLATFFLYLSIVAHFGLTIIDQWFITSKKSTQETGHNISLIVLLIIVVTAEFGRQAKERDELLENLPKEEQRKVTLGRKHASVHSGFLLLIDAVAWTEHQEALLSGIQEWEFQNQVNKYLLKIFHDRETSVLTGTGDGFYFAWEGPPSAERLRNICERIELLINSPVDLNDLGLQATGPSGNLEFRAALTYGEYAIGRSRYKELTRDFATGKPLNRLARIIGNEKRTFRILPDEKLRVFTRIGGLAPNAIVDKHGRGWKYFQLTPNELVRLLESKGSVDGLLSPMRAA